jgi:hypothetical protein
LLLINQLDVHVLGDDVFFAGWRGRNGHSRRSRKILKIGRGAAIANDPADEPAIEFRQIGFAAAGVVALFRAAGCSATWAAVLDAGAGIVAETFFFPHPLTATTAARLKAKPSVILISFSLGSAFTTRLNFILSANCGSDRVKG